MNLRNHRWIAAALLALSALFGMPALAQDAPRPWFAFASRDEAGLEVVNRYFRRGDFLNVNAARKVKDLRERIGEDRIFRLSASLDDVAEWSRKPCNDRESAKLILYDIEEWEATPAAERADVSGSMGRAADIVKGSGCRTYGIAPARAYLSGTDKQCEIGVGPVPRNVQWRNVSVFVIQAQGLLRENCTRRAGIEAYRRFIGDMTALAKRANPNVIVLAEVSFNRSRPDVIVQAIDQTRSLVDGYYLAYPVEGEKCEYCTPRDLEFVLARYRAPAR
jgi:hypothetical protein